MHQGFDPINPLRRMGDACESRDESGFVNKQQHSQYSKHLLLIYRVLVLQIVSIQTDIKINHTEVTFVLKYVFIMLRIK